MRQLGPGEPQRGDQLVVARQDRLGTVQDGDPAGLQAAQLGDAGLGTVERRPHVEVGEDEIAGRGPPGYLRRRGHDCLQSHPGSGRGEGGGDG